MFSCSSHVHTSPVNAVVPGGAAVVLSLNKVKEKAIRIAAHKLEAAVEDVELAEGTYRVKGVPTRGLSLAEIAKTGVDLISVGWITHSAPALDVALEARTGRRVWEVEVAPRSEGYSNSSGPLVAGGKVIVGLGGCARFGGDGCYISAYDPATGARA